MQRNPSGFGPLLFAITCQRPRIVALLLEAGISPEEEVSEGLGMTALQLAAGADCVEVTDVLIQFGADVNRMAARGRTALHEAVDAGQTAQVVRLLRAGAVSTAGRFGTPLQIALRSRRWDIAESLFQYGVSADERSESGLTALQEAVVEKRSDVASFLIKHGATCDVRTAEGETLLDLAVLPLDDEWERWDGYEGDCAQTLAIITEAISSRDVG